MCLTLPSRVVDISSPGVAKVESADGQVTSVNALLKADLAVGDWVLVDRGIIVETITADEAQAILSIYAEIDSLLEEDNALT